jgi:chromosome partitioning protein
MGKIMAVVNQKGGVGKTTTAVNLASSLGEKKKKVLIVDVDPQANTTSGFGVDKRELEHTTYDVLLGETKAEDAVRHTGFKGVDLLPSAMALVNAEVELVEVPRRENRLKAALAPLRDRYDYILIDCPPSLGLLCLNGLCAADTLLVPIQCEYYALEGLAQLMTTVRQVKRSFNPGLELEGVVMTMYDKRLNLTKQVVEEVEKNFPRKVFSTVIPRTVRLSEAPSYGKPINYYDHASKGARAYRKLAEELIRKG